MQLEMKASAIRMVFILINILEVIKENQRWPNKQYKYLNLFLYTPYIAMPMPGHLILFGVIYINMCWNKSHIYTIHLMKSCWYYPLNNACIKRVVIAKYHLYKTLLSFLTIKFYVTHTHTQAIYAFNTITRKTLNIKVQSK